MYTLRFCTQTLFTMISDHQYNMTPFRFRSGTDMVTTVIADTKEALVDIAYHIDLWQENHLGYPSNFNKDHILKVIKTTGE